jgi:hypothetical protein
VKSRPFPDAIQNQFVLNSPKFQMLVLSRGTQLTKNFQNVSLIETSQSNVVLDEFGLVTEILKAAMKLAVFKILLAQQLKNHLVDQLKILFKSLFHIQRANNTDHVFNSLANVTINSVTSQVLAKKTSNQSTEWTKTTVVKSCWNVFHQFTNVPEKSAMDGGDTLLPLTLVKSTKKDTVNLALVLKVTSGVVMMNETLVQIFQSAPKTNTSLQLNLGVTTATTHG